MGRGGSHTQVIAAWRYRFRGESHESEHPSQFFGYQRAGLSSDSDRDSPGNAGKLIGPLQSCPIPDWF
jgi:hypothetical protein